MDRQQRYDQIYEELYQSRPYLRLHNEAMRLLGDVRLEYPEGSPEFREGTLAAYRVEEEAMRIFREMPGTPEEREPEWPYFHRGIAVMALQGGLSDEAAYWAEEGLRSASDTELRDQLFNLIAKSKPEKLLNRLKEKSAQVNGNTGCFNDLPAEDHTPENAVDCFSELIAMLDALEQWAGKLYKEKSFDQLWYENVIKSRINRMRWVAEILKSLDFTEDSFEYYLDMVSDDLQWLTDFDIKNINSIILLNLYISCASTSFGVAQKVGMISQAGNLLDKVENMIEGLLQSNQSESLSGIVLFQFYSTQGVRYESTSKEVEYLSKTSLALEKWPQNTEAGQNSYLMLRLVVSLKLVYAYWHTGDHELAYKTVMRQEKMIQENGYGQLLARIGPLARLLHADWSLLAAKVLANRKADWTQHLNRVEENVDKIKKQEEKASNASIPALELERLMGEARMLQDMPDNSQMQLGPPPAYLQNLMDSMLRPAA